VSPIIISCKAPDWRDVLKVNLQDGDEVDLTNFDYTADGQLCEMLSLTHGMIFRLDAKNQAGFFRRRKGD
jgi:hypothetical protein